MPSTHNGTCAFCGSQVDRRFFTCTGCGATWTSTVNLLGYALFATSLPCGVLAAIVIGMQTLSPVMAMVALFVGGLGMAALSTSNLFRTCLWVR